MMEEVFRWDRDEIIINGKKLNADQTTILIEAIYGNVQFGTQCEGWLEDACGISVDRQMEIVNEVDNMFVR